MSETRSGTGLERAARVAVALFLGLVVYILSSGPVLALAFWLRERTRWDGFYMAMYLYLPIFALGHDQPLDWYIEWWVWLVGAPGPG